MDFNHQPMKNNFKRMLYIWLSVLVGSVSFPGKAYSLLNDKASFQTNKDLKEIENLEYDVYTDFFSTEKLPAIELPQFFEHAVQCRKIFETTDLAKLIKQDELSSLKKFFGVAVSTSLNDYIQKNTTEYLVKERMKVADLTVFTKEQRDKLFSGGLSEVPSHVTGEYVSVSSVGFNAKKDTAFFRIVWNGSAVTSYYVMMQKKENKWLIINTTMDNMIIF